ncbi:hypothetical protein [Candidatus Binatus sp.]|uniref:hypothetical protein n=1 Tax=Candidatus Binatus sp. TaxID=2811406 RepID=UPI002FDA0D8B
MAIFSGILAPPTGLALATVYQSRSGATYTPDGSGHVTVTDARDFAALVGDQGWSVISVTTSG